MTIGVIARIRIHAGKGPEFEAAFTEQAKAVRANEPANSLYQLVRSREDKTSYLVMELYTDDEALELHRSGKHMLANRPKIAPLIAERAVIEVFDAV